MSETARRKRPSRPPGTPGLYLSAGEAPTEGRNYPRKLDYIRPKPGRDEQFREYADKFTEVYGPTPRSVDVLFLSDRISDVLDVRPKLYGTGGIRAVGFDNLAELERDDFLASLDAFDWHLETRPEGRPEPGTYDLKGRDDPLVVKHKLKVYGTLRVAIPKVTGLMLLAEIATTSRRSIVNWYDNLTQALFLTGGVLVGIPHELRLRPARTTYFDEKEKKRRTSEFYEWVLESAYDLGTLQHLVAERRAALRGGAPLAELPPVQHEDVTRDGELAEALWQQGEERRARRAASELPSPGEDVAVREEPRAGADDALLNRIARLEEELGSEAALVTLRGVYGVEDARELDADDATRYAEQLERAASEAADVAEFVDVDEDSAPGVASAPTENGAADAAKSGAGAEHRSSEEDSAEEATVGAEHLFDEGSSEAEGSVGDSSLPGEPDDRLLDPVDIAGGIAVPLGRHAGKAIRDLESKPQWIVWALRKPPELADEEMFLAALDLYARERLPELWKRAKEEK
jgi:Recombination directionality factor-like